MLFTKRSGVRNELPQEEWQVRLECLVRMGKSGGEEMSEAIGLLVFLLSIWCMALTLATDKLNRKIRKLEARK